MRVFEVKVHYSWKQDFNVFEGTFMKWNIPASNDVEASSKAKASTIEHCKEKYDEFKGESKDGFNFPIIEFCETRLLCIIDEPV